MAIVTMKKLRAAVMADRRDELLQGLLRLGCVQIREPEDTEWAERFRRCPSALAEVRGRLAEVDVVLDALRRYGWTDEGLFSQRRAV